jgi:transposase-like protein
MTPNLLSSRRFTKRWTMPIKGWKTALNEFAILFEGRLPQSAKN